MDSPHALTMEKSVQCDFSVTNLDTVDNEKENQKIEVIHADDGNTKVAMTNGHAFQMLQSNEPQPLVKAISEAKHPFLETILNKQVQDDINMEILDFHSNRMSLTPLLAKPDSLVTVMKFQKGEFVEVKNSSSYNSSMCLHDMKTALTAALDSCISQSNVELNAPSPPKSNLKQDETEKLAENPSQGKTPKTMPPRKPKVTQGEMGIPDNNKGSKSPKTTKPKVTPDASKPTAVKKKLVAEKMKNVEISKGSTLIVEQPKAKPAKPAQAMRVKKPKIPDEESIKFANRQKEIQRMKKELKEKLKREGKEGVDPAARVNAWGRTVGITCTMCGLHVQKSYGCFRRDTAPEKLLHLFTPGMNRIKICRRCLPYKKQPGKGENDGKVLNRPGLKALGQNPRVLNSGVPSILEKPVSTLVSTSTLNAIQRKVLAAQESAGDENKTHANPGQVNVVPDHGSVGFSHVNISPNYVSMNNAVVNLGSAHVNMFAGHVNSVPGHVNTELGQANNLIGHVNSVIGNVTAASGHLNVYSGHTNTVPDHVHTNSGHMNSGPIHVIDTTAPSAPPEIDLSESSQGSAIEYIRKLALNLQTNFNDQGNKTEVKTPEGQIMKTPLVEQFANMTPVTPSVTHQVASKEDAASWKPVLNQVYSLSDGQTNFSQGSASWTTMPIVLKTQPNIVLTSSNQNPAKTFVTAANQKLVPTMVMPSQNAPPEQRPVVLQIQQVKLVETGESGQTKNQSKPGDVIPSSCERGLPEIQVENETDNLQKYSESAEAQVTQVEETSDAEIKTITLEALAEEISSSQLEAPIRLTGEKMTSSEIEDSSGSMQSLDADTTENTCDQGEIDTVDPVGIEKVTISGHLHEATSENVVDLKILESGSFHQNEAGSIVTSYPESTVVICGSVDNQSPTMHPEGFQSSNDGQDSAPEINKDTCKRNVFASQISEEYLPQTKEIEFEGAGQNLERETVKEFVSDILLRDDEVLEKKFECFSRSSEETAKEVKNSVLKVDAVLDEKGEHLNDSNVEKVVNDGLIKKDAKRLHHQAVLPVVHLSECEKHEFVHEGSEIKEEDRNMGDVEKMDCEQEHEGEVNVNETNDVEKQSKAKNSEETRYMEVTMNNETTKCETTESLGNNDDIPLDRRRSQRRVISPRRSESPVKSERKIATRNHGTRQSTLRQKEETANDRTGQQRIQSDKSVQQSTQKSKTEGLRKVGKEKESSQGVKRKRGRPAKKTKIEEEKNNEDLVKGNSPSKRMKPKKE